MHAPLPAAAQIPKLMAAFEKGLSEGNGRVARLLAVLMGLQAGLPALYFENLSGRKRQQYFAAVRAGLEQNYEPMRKLFSGVVRRTLGIHGEPVERPW